MGGEADPKDGMMNKKEMKNMIDGTHHKDQTKDMKKKIRHKKETEDTVERNLIEGMMIEASKDPLEELHTVGYIMMKEEKDLPAEIDQTALRDMEAMMMTEKMIEEDQQNIVNIQIKDMMKKTEEQMKKGKEQEVPQKIDIEMKTLTMNMDLKDK